MKFKDQQESNLSIPMGVKGENNVRVPILLHIPFQSPHIRPCLEALGKLPKPRVCTGSCPHSCCESELWNQANVCLILGLTLASHRKEYEELENVSVYHL